MRGKRGVLRAYFVTLGALVRIGDGGGGGGALK
jgi:hypothetical protein